MPGESSRIRRKKNTGESPSPGALKITRGKAGKGTSPEELPEEGFEGSEESRKFSPHYFSRSGLFGEIMEKLPLGIMGRDMTGGGRYVFWNVFMEELTGISRKSILHHPGDSVLPRERQELFQEQDARVMREERSLDCGLVPFPGVAGARIHMVKILFRESHTGHRLVVSILQDLSRQALLEGRLRYAERTAGLLREYGERVSRILRGTLEQGGESSPFREQLLQALMLTKRMGGEEDVLEASPGTAEQRSEQAPSEKALPRVYLLERDATVRAFALRTLQWEGWPVRTAESLEELVHALEEENPEDGLFLLGHEDLDFPRGVPGKAVVLRGEGMPRKSMDECRRRGYEICPKPFAAWELLESLRRCAAGSVGEKASFGEEI